MKDTVDVVATIKAQRVDATARAMMVSGVRLTADQIEEVGDVGCDWLKHRLGLVMRDVDSDGSASWTVAS